MTRTLIGFVAVLVLSSAAMAYTYGYDPAKVQFGGHYMELAQDPVPVAGGYEYILDMYVAGSMVSGTSTEIWGFDNTKILNMEDDVSWYGSWGGLDDNIIMECWDSYGNEADTGEFKTPSIDDGAGGWTLTSYPWSMINDWHVPGDYAGGWKAFHTASVVNAGAPYGGGTARDDCIPVNNYWWSTNPAGVLYTVRVVYEDKLVEGEIRWSLWNDATDNPVMGQWFPEGVPGDFDGDGDGDADDIDILCANMGGALDPYDLDSNGVVDEDDMIYHVENLVEYDTDDDGTPDGTGTYQGDFNLDGVVNATDLQIMKTSFGLSGVGYAAGNANCDTVVNATDLQILKAKFGLVASAVPEPLTIGLLAVGGVALLRRRK